MHDQIYAVVAQSPVNLEYLEKLLDEYQEILKYEAQFPQSNPLFIAIDKNIPFVLELIIKYSKCFNFNLKNEIHQTPLIIAVKSGYQKCVELLLSVPEVDVNIGDHNNDTPLIWAAWFGHLNILQMLLNHPDIDLEKTSNYANYNGFTALHCAISGSKYIIAQILIENGADVDAKTVNNLTIIDLLPRTTLPHIMLERINEGCENIFEQRLTEFLFSKPLKLLSSQPLFEPYIIKEITKFMHRKF